MRRARSTPPQEAPATPGLVWRTRANGETAPVAPASRNRRGLATRQAILDAALRVVEEQGFDELSLDRVARTAGVSRSSVYHQFASRDGLFLEAIAESLRRSAAQRRPPVGKRRGTGFDRFLHEAESAIRADASLLRLFFRLVFDRGWNQGEMNRILRDGFRERTRRIARGLSEEGSGVPPEELELLAILLGATVDGLYAWRLIDPRGSRLGEVLALLSDLVRRRLAGAPEVPDATPERTAGARKRRVRAAVFSDRSPA